MSARQHNALDCAGRNGALDWTVHRYGYEHYVVLNERGHEVAATHRRDTANLIAAAPELLEACRRALGCDLDPATNMAIRSAIARATGAA